MLIGTIKIFMITLETQLNWGTTMCFKKKYDRSIDLLYIYIYIYVYINIYIYIYKDACCVPSQILMHGILSGIMFGNNYQFLA